VTDAAGPGEDVVDVLVRRLDPDVALPAAAHPGDAGADLVTTVDVELGPGERVTVPTGIAIALPAGYAAFVLPRSGLAARYGVGIVNAPGTIDAGYRGEIMVTLVNHDLTNSVSLFRGDRIAQLVVQRVERALFHEVDALPGSARGSGGLGSTGGFAESSYGGVASGRLIDDATE
jgi:dUTP pyrophosphatase